MKKLLVIFLTLAILKSISYAAYKCSPKLFLTDPGNLTRDSVTLLSTLGYSGTMKVKYNTKFCRENNFVLSKREYEDLASVVASSESAFLLVKRGCLVNVSLFEDKRRLTFISSKDKCFTSQKLYRTKFGPVQQVYVHEELIKYFEKRKINNSSKALRKKRRKTLRVRRK